MNNNSFTSSKKKIKEIVSALNKSLGEQTYRGKNPFICDGCFKKHEYGKVIFGGISNLHLCYECYKYAKEKNDMEDVGIGGAINFIIPLLNDYYSGWEAHNWQKPCLDIIKDGLNVYLTLIKRFKNILKKHDRYSVESLFTSFNEPYLLWDSAKNRRIYKMLKKA